VGLWTPRRRQVVRFSDLRIFGAATFATAWLLLLPPINGQLQSSVRYNNNNNNTGKAMTGRLNACSRNSSSCFFLI
jgi:hypothetical protein